MESKKCIFTLWNCITIVCKDMVKKYWRTVLAREKNTKRYLIKYVLELFATLFVKI